MIIGLIQVSLILLVSQYLFDLPIRGRVIDLYLAAALFILAALALGLTVFNPGKKPSSRRFS